MMIKDYKKCPEIIAGDKSILRELLNPLKEKLPINYSLAIAKVKANKTTLWHRLKSTEVYYIIQGKGLMYINNEKALVCKGQVIYIPCQAMQRIKNIGKTDLVFLCIVEPAWRKENEEIRGGAK